MAKADTKNKPAPAPQQDQQQQQSRQQVATLAPPRLPYNSIFEQRYGVTGMEWRALVDAVFPSAKTVEGVILALSYCKARKLDPMKRPVHIVPIWNSKENREVESVWPGIGELRTTAFRTKQYAGCDPAVFGPMKKMHFEGTVGKGQYEKKVSADVEFPEWCQITVYRMIEGVRCAFPGPRVYWLAAYGCQGKSDVPNDKWQEGGGSYMLEKCTEAAALRKAFPEDLQGMLAAEEMEGRKMEAGGVVIDNEPAPPRPTRESVQRDAEQEQRQQEQVQREEEDRQEQFRHAAQGARAPQQRQEPEHDEETGEIAQNETDEDQSPPDGPGVAENSDAQPSPSASPGTEKTGNNPSHPPAHDPAQYVGMTKMILDKITNAGIKKTFDSILVTYADEIAALQKNSTSNYDAVQKAIEEKKAWFAR